MTLAEVQMTGQNLAMIAMKKLPHDLAYVVSKNLMVLQSDIRLMEERKREIAKTYAEKDETGNYITKDNCYTFSAEEAKAFEQEFAEFLGTETEVAIYTVTEDEFVQALKKTESDRFDVLAPAEMIALDFMIQKEENRNDK